MDRPYRLLTALYFDLGKTPGGGRGTSTSLVVMLTPDGTHSNNTVVRTTARRGGKSALIPANQLPCEVADEAAFWDQLLTEK
jgi:hypothetical protein